MANPTKPCESCKGTGKVVDHEMKMHRDSGKERPNKNKKGQLGPDTSKPKNPKNPTPEKNIK